MVGRIAIPPCGALRPTRPTEGGCTKGGCSEGGCTEGGCAAGGCAAGGDHDRDGHATWAEQMLKMKLKDNKQDPSLVALHPLLKFFLGTAG